MWIATLLPVNPESGPPQHGVGNTEEEAIDALHIEYVTPWYNRSPAWGDQAENDWVHSDRERVTVVEIYGVDVIHNPNKE